MSSCWFFVLKSPVHAQLLKCKSPHIIYLLYTSFVSLKPASAYTIVIILQNYKSHGPEIGTLYGDSRFDKKMRYVIVSTSQFIKYQDIECRLAPSKMTMPNL